MSTIANTIAVAKVTSVLASRDIAKGNLFPTVIRTEPRFPLMITTERIIIEGVYNRVPTYPNLQIAADYLYDLCGKYRLAAQAIVDGGGGGSVAPVTPGQPDIYPLYITSTDFEPDGISYDNPDIVGDNLILFVNEYTQQWLPAGASTFSYTPNGLVMNIPGFDANTQSWTIVIEKFNN